MCVSMCACVCVVCGVRVCMCACVREIGNMCMYMTGYQTSGNRHGPSPAVWLYPCVARPFIAGGLHDIHRGQRKTCVLCFSWPRLPGTAWSADGTLLRWQTLVWLAALPMMSIRPRRGPNSQSSGLHQRSSLMPGSAASPTCGLTVRYMGGDGRQ